MPNLIKKENNYKKTFSRYEFKYILSKSLSDRIENEVKNFMKHDGFIHKELDNRYFVRSLYFDNKFFSNFYEKVDGIKIRKKFRIRSYTNKKKQRIFFIFRNERQKKPENLQTSNSIVI